LEDLFVINYRLQGLAEKICKTHAIVLTKLIKLGVRSENGHWLVLDVGIYSYQGVFEERCRTHKQI
jgi:hypothetical protein